MLVSHDAEPGFSVSAARGAGGGVVITVIGDLDAATAPELLAAYERSGELDGALVVDLRGCTFMDSTGIAAIVGIAWRQHEAGGSLILRGVGPRVRHILELTGIAEHEAIEIEPLG